MIFFLIFAQNIDCGYTLDPPRRGGSNEYPQSMFWIKNKENRYTHANPILLYKSGVQWGMISQTCFRDATQIKINLLKSMFSMISNIGSSDELHIYIHH